MCLYPRIIRNKKYTATIKNGGIIPAYPDNRVLGIPVGCQKCIECTKQRARNWQTRLKEDIRHNTNGMFVTLTFSEEWYNKIKNGYITKKGKEIKGIDLEKYKTEYDIDNEIARKATKFFRERWRKETGKSIRHWLVTELGHNGTERIHLHGILFVDNEHKNIITKTWKYGFTWLGYRNQKNYVNEKTINYITKYVSKIDFKHKEYKPIILTSPGMGKGYINRIDAQNNKYKKGNTNECYTNRQGIRVALPTYWRNKIYTEEEREKLWLEKLDKEERYVLGVKIDISQGTRGYFNALKFAREKNKRLGYGDNSKNWIREEYENKIRKMKRNNENDNKNNGENMVDIHMEYKSNHQDKAITNYINKLDINDLWEIECPF